MTDIERAKARCQKHEGLRLTRYRCSNGRWTIGYGHLCSADQRPITRVEAAMMFDSDWKKRENRIRKLLDDREIEGLDDVRFGVLVEMCFQLGPPYDFPSMLRAIRRGNWQRAAAEMMWSNGLTQDKRSDWWDDTPERCELLAKIMETGYDGGDYAPA